MGSSSAPLCSWMPCLPLASAVPTEAVDTGSPGENTRHCLVGTAEPNGLPVGCPPPSQHSQGHTEQQVPQPSHCHCPMPGPARAGAPATAKQGGGPGLRARVGSAPAAPAHQAGLDNSAGTAATDRASKPYTLSAPLTCIHCLASSCTSLWYKCTRAGSLGVQ